MSARRSGRSVARAIVAGFVVFAGGSLVAAAPAHAKGGTHNVVGTEKEYSMSFPATIKAGKVKLQTHNTGTVVHELVVLRTDVPADKLKLTATGAFDEKDPALKDVGEAENVKPGAAGSVTIDLKPGKYVFACNMADHYKRGMREQITVT